jgi:biofilm protein TabA
MRKVAFTSGQDSIKKVMLYDCSDGVYVFGYDCLQDTSSISDYLQDTVEDAEGFCKEEYNIMSSNWILIDDPLDNCQHDFILPTKVKGKENDNPEWGQFQTLVDNRWVDIGASDKTQSFGGLTVNERLFVSGLITEFEKSKISDKTKAKQILRSLQVDEPSIELIVK